MTTRLSSTEALLRALAEPELASDLGAVTDPGVGRVVRVNLAALRAVPPLTRAEIHRRAAAALAAALGSWPAAWTDWAVRGRWHPPRSVWEEICAFGAPHAGPTEAALFVHASLRVIRALARPPEGF